MSKPNDGGPAFPNVAIYASNDPPRGGMSLRAWLAGMALNEKEHSAITSAWFEAHPGKDCVTNVEIRVWNADRMIAELEKGKA